MNKLHYILRQEKKKAQNLVFAQIQNAWKFIMMQQFLELLNKISTFSNEKNILVRKVFFWGVRKDDDDIH